MEQFRLAQDAAKWTADAVADNVRLTCPIGDDWIASYDEDGTTVQLLVHEAHGDVILAPEGVTVEFELSPDGDGDTYRWLLYITQPARLIVASWSTSMALLGDGESSKGADSALAVLIEAVDAANRLLAQLAGYVSATAGVPF